MGKLEATFVRFLIELQSCDFHRQSWTHGCRFIFEVAGKLQLVCENMKIHWIFFWENWKLLSLDS